MKPPISPKRERAFSSWVLGTLALVVALLIWPSIRPCACGDGTLAVINNLRIIEGAKGQWALENKIPPYGRAAWTNIAPYLKGGTVPRYKSETYTLNRIATPAFARTPVALGSYQAGSVIIAP
ncbi:MAG TPA: hypothetical protein VHH73_18830 [Verrucomicrobiae bacterium]|nr:hypothetical protein [Verrucomicrobiae bacterium]